MKLDPINMGLIVGAIILGVTYFSMRNARRQKEQRSRRKMI